MSSKSSPTDCISLPLDKETNFIKITLLDYAQQDSERKEAEVECPILLRYINPKT